MDLIFLKGGIAFSSNDAIDIAKKIDSSKWVVKAQIHAGGRRKRRWNKIANSLEGSEELSESILGMNLITPQTGVKRKKSS